MKTFRRLLVICLLLIPLAVTAVYLFKTLDSRNRLNISQINCVLKDSRGFVWFGTPAGLYRYDGYTFKSFQCNSQDGTSLPDSYITSLQEALDGSLWVQTTSGMCVYSPQSESFERDMRQVFSKMGINEVPKLVYIDQKKNLWAYIPNRGVLGYNMQQQLLYEFSYTDDVKGIPQGNVCSISECREGALIVYDDGTIACCDIMHQQHTQWVNRFISTSHLRKTPTLKAFADQVGNIWLYGHGTLMVYYKNANKWDTAIGDQIGMTGVDVDRTVCGMAGDRSGNIWIGTDRSGLICMNVNTHVMEPVSPRSVNDNQNIDRMSSVLSVYVDDTDLLWVGTEKAGVAYYGSNIYKFQSELNGDITAMTQDANGRVWFGTNDNGVIGYDGPLASQKVSAMACTKDGSLWVGSRQNGLTRVKDGKATIYKSSDQDDNGNRLIDNSINALCCDRTGSLWIATNGGLQVYNPRMNTFSTYTKENGRLTTNNITSLYYGKDNNLLVGTGEGLMIINLSTTEQTTLTGNKSNVKSFTNDYITQVMQDSRGLIWIGTREGLNVFDAESDSLNYITEKNGLCNNCICGITEDKNHNVWITTSNGVSRVVVQRDHVEGTFTFGLYNYDMTDGLQSSEFNMGSILTKADGNVLLGGLNGVNWVSRRSSESTDALPRVMLTQLFIGETEVQIGHEYDGYVPLPQALNESNAIELLNNQNTFTIKFAAGNYNQSERLQFMYWMEGLDDQWRNGDALLHGVTFRNLSSGKYILHVKAMSADGAVSKQERTLVIRIDRPWWLSWWMVASYIIIIVIGFVAWRMATRRISYVWSKKKEIIKELSRQREEIKLASDDLRQPMSRMTSIIGSMTESATTVESKEQINSLHFQMLQVITRISEMQMHLEDPESKASATASDRLQLNDKGELDLLQNIGTELTADLRPRKTGLATQQYSIMIIDDNGEFLKFIRTFMDNFYNLYTYDDMDKAVADIETIKPDIIVCKEEMAKMTGSELCNRIKTNVRTQSIKFVLMTNGVLSAGDMRAQNITLSADDYLSKPFNIQETIMRFNKLLGLAAVDGLSDAIEGQETRMLEGYNSSMTTATVDYSQYLGSSKEGETDTGENAGRQAGDEAADDSSAVTDNVPAQNEILNEQMTDDYINSEYSMSSVAERQLMKNVEQYVIQNMSHGQINLEEMASAMGMGRVPFFHKIKSITSKTPAELVRDLKLKHACTLLERTDINLSELAINVGFITAENFINVFKDRYGMSPLEYRLSHRRK